MKVSSMAPLSEKMSSMKPSSMKMSSMAPSSMKLSSMRKSINMSKPIKSMISSNMVKQSMNMSKPIKSMISTNMVKQSMNMSKPMKSSSMKLSTMKPSSMKMSSAKLSSMKMSTIKPTSSKKMTVSSSIAVPIVTPDNYTAVNSENGFKIKDIVNLPSGQNIAISSVNITTGKIEVKDASGSTWSALGATSMSQAVVRPKDSFIRLVSEQIVNRKDLNDSRILGPFALINETYYLFFARKSYFKSQVLVILNSDEVKILFRFLTDVSKILCLLEVIKFQI